MKTEQHNVLYAAVQYLFKANKLFVNLFVVKSNQIC